MADDAGLINEVLAETSFLYGGNAAFVEDLYARWVADPNSVEPSWRAFVQTLGDRADEVKQAVAEPGWARPGVPLPRPEWLAALDGLWPAVQAKTLVWVQEEPKNMGGWTFVDPWLELTLERLNIASKRARYVGRPASASTAAGWMSRHQKELESFLKEAFA